MTGDLRFYDRLGPVRLGDLCDRAGATLVDAARADALIDTAAPLSEAGPSAIAFLESSKYVKRLDDTRAAACFVRPADRERAESVGVTALVTETPQASFARALHALFRAKPVHDGDALIHPSADIDPSARVSAGAAVGANARIGPRAEIGPNAVVGTGVSIGEDARIGAGAVVIFAAIGARTAVMAGAVIGETGFAIARGADGAVDVLHLGAVRVGEDVVIGANAAVDRAMFALTEIGDGSKIDNLVQIAHNVQVGRSCILAGCCGISGSVVIGDGAVLGGGVGVADHVTIGAGAALAGATLVMRDVPAGETWAGTPAQPIRTFFREVAALRRLTRSGG